MCTLFIREEVAQTDLNVMMKSRQFLSYGKRGAVDVALSRMVAEGILVRVARGMFVKPGSVMPSIVDIAQAKAIAFAREIVEHAALVAAEFGLQPPPEVAQYSIVGSSSLFTLANEEKEPIKLCGTARRKMLLNLTECGRRVRAVWERKKVNFDDETCSILPEDIRLYSLEERRWVTALAPSWITDRLIERTG